VIATGGKLPTALIYLFVALFGFCHGYAHGVEIPSLAEPQYYAGGFVVSTIMIHIAGVIIGYGYAVGNETGLTLLRYTGACVMGAGLQMLMENFLE
jgi:urease accessory protein